MNPTPSIDLIATGANITRLRKASGLSVRDVQVLLGLSAPQAIYKWQAGDALPTVDNLLVLASILGVKMDDIIITASTVA